MLKRLTLLLISALLISACAPPNLNIAFSDLPEGDPERGQLLFERSIQAPACISCHRTDSVNAVGPGLGGFSERAGTRVAGLSAAEYAFQSIDRPASFLVPGFSNLMYSAYDANFTAQDVADLIAYLMTL